MTERLERLELLIGRILMAGVALAGAIVALGGVLYLVRHGGEYIHYDVFTGEPTRLRTIADVAADALHLSGRALIQLGLLVLVATQIVRVAATFWLFRVARDTAFVYISLLVLATLVYSLLGPG